MLVRGTQHAVLRLDCTLYVLVHAVTAEDAPTKPDPLSRRSGTRQRHGIPNLVWHWPCPNHGERAQVVPSAESKLFVEHLFRTSAARGAGHYARSLSVKIQI